ncbi:hypothetical protein AMATHDRAFT_136328 [Amanita thiersii Skay4041]|uniref:Pop1 N-terminal domain-containing protein n=1 Tax=Amanita thiersii Skay4041 TaxID=703135 RepID=A0A2A9P0I4_9AGAR|nr:hypothetical protein AMATHDRAFT_136328 [Amanita thiersii Skay4041]
MSRLPSAIDVEKFVEARAFEIHAMEDAMKNAGESSTHRVWQTLPRHLRRRAASHDVRRVPRRLRDKARAEMDPVKKVSKSKVAKRGKAKKLSRTESLSKRQVEKMWLESHLWHAKRMKMENMWGYRLALHPTEKAFRSSHRASVHGSILHDASYFSLIELKGVQKLIEETLLSCCDPQGPNPGSKRYTTGSRSLETHVYKTGCYPFDLLVPATILWRPLDGDAQDNTRSVWLIFHPAAYEEVFSTIQESAVIAVEAARRRKSDGGFDIEIIDLRSHVNIFELMGPKSNQVLKGVLKPISQDNRSSFRQFWSALADMPCSGSLPRGMVIGFKVIDPRLEFPHQNAKPKLDNRKYPFLVPEGGLANSEIWDQSIRLGLSKPRFKKMELDQRRSQSLVPGTPVNPLRQDDRIPLLLIQYSLENTTNESRSLHGWRLIVPAGWSMAFFSSLVFTGTRVGGQRERQTQAFEAGLTYFPRDFPFTRGYTTYSDERENDERGYWNRKPPAKRVNYTKLGIRSPWRADWEVILGLSDEDFVTTQRDDSMDVSLARDTIRPCLLQGPLMKEFNKLRRGFGLDPLIVKSGELLQGALMPVSINMCKRGMPEEMDTIHIMGDEEASKWMKAMQRHRSLAMLTEADDDSPEELSVFRPPHSTIVGYVTTGNYSLSRSKGFAIGAISLSRMIELEEQIARYEIYNLLYSMT